VESNLVVTAFQRTTLISGSQQQTDWRLDGVEGHVRNNSKEKMGGRTAKETEAYPEGRDFERTNLRARTYVQRKGHFPLVETKHKELRRKGGRRGGLSLWGGQAIREITASSEREKWDVHGAERP